MMQEEIMERLLNRLDSIASALEHISKDLNRISTDCLTVSGSVEVSGDIDVSTDKLY